LASSALATTRLSDLAPVCATPNRIISGLAIAVVVVEAGVNSGALITAGFALDHGRDVFACTTGPENPAGAGVRELLRDGARLVVDPEQALEQLIDLASAQGYESVRPVPAPSGEAPVCLAGDRRDAYEAITEGTTTDEIAAMSGLESRRVASVLSELELEGLVWSDHGMWYRHGPEA
jgi:DNA processing protein